jgi:hypothetical protein
VLPNLLENVLDRQPGPQETHTARVHELQKIAAGAVDASHILQVDLNLPGRIAISGRFPAILQLGHERPSQPAFHLKDHPIVEFLGLNLHHGVAGSQVPWLLVHALRQAIRIAK